MFLPLILLSLLVQDPLETQGWTFMALSDETRVYMKHEPAAGGLKRAWTLYDSARKRERPTFSFMSVMSLGEYDCAAGKSRTARETFYEQGAMKGAPHELDGPLPTEWASHAPDSIGEIKFEFACGAARPVNQQG